MPLTETAGTAAGAGGALRGRNVLICREQSESRELLAAFAELGATATAQALIETVPPADPAQLRTAVAAWNRGECDWCAVTSAHGARAFAAAGAVSGAGLVAAVGPATAAALEAHGFAVDLMPERDFSGQGLADALIARLGGAPASAAVRRVLLPVSDLADSTVESALAAAGHKPSRVTAYRTVPATLRTGASDVFAAVAGGTFDAVLVLSASGAAQLATVTPEIPLDTRIIAIGHPTARALSAAGLRADVIADPHTGHGLVAACVATLGRP